MSDTQKIEALVADLAAAIGPSQVQFDTMSRILYSTDASNYQIMPIGVTFPRSSDDVCAIHEIANRHDVPVLPRGGGSSLAGQTVGHAVVMDFTRHMRRVTGIHAEERFVSVEPGLILGQLNNQLAHLGLTFGPDPASAERAAVGGVIGNNATGAHSIVYGMSADHVRRLQVVLANGEKVWLDADSETLRKIRSEVAAIVNHNADDIKTRYPKTWRTCAGYALDKIDPDDVNLNWLLAGSEGTLATIVQAELNLVQSYKPAEKALALIHFDSVRASLEATPRILELKPTAVELMDKFLLDKTRANVEFSQSLTFVDGDPAAILVVEFVGESESHLHQQIDALKAWLNQSPYKTRMTLATTPGAQANVWKVRKAGLGLLMSERTDAKPIPFIEDAAVPVENLADYIQDVEKIILGEGTTYAVYAHASAGCLHVRPLINLKTVTGHEQYRNIMDQVAQTILKYQGTITGEHGKGLVRGQQQQVIFGDQLMDAFRQVKGAFDPDNRMNPGKMADSPAMDDPTILRYNTDYNVIPIRTRFDWQADKGLAGAVEMCNGAGVCRKEGVGTMCPSYQATRDEAHSTRGRANALRAAISGKLPDGLNSQALHEVYALCLSCKACKSECPSSVDVAMLKSEYLAQYHDQHGIGLKTWAFGNIHVINRLAGRLPALSNFMLSSGFGKSMLRLFGMPTERPLPLYAPRPFMAGYRTQTQPGVPTLMVDTFANYNEPGIVQAIIDVAADLNAPLNVQMIPAGTTGRPAISKGLLDAAKRIAHRNVQAWANLTGPLIFIEPSEYSALIDEYPRLVAPEWRMKVQELGERAMMIETWLAQQMHKSADSLSWDEQPRNIMLHGHCHQKSLWGTADTLALLNCIPNATVSEIPSGCCGVAGSFGYEHYDISMKVANDRLLPAIENAPAGTLIAAPGTSCRAQISDNGHSVYHPAEIVRTALKST